MTPEGTWQLVIKTPVGSLPVELVVSDTDGVVTGLARGQAQDIAIPDMILTHSADGHHLTWTQQVTRPLRLTLEFDVLVTGNNLSGTARAGRLPASQVSGTRVPRTA